MISDNDDLLPASLEQRYNPPLNRAQLTSNVMRQLPAVLVAVAVDLRPAPSTHARLGRQ